MQTRAVIGALLLVVATAAITSQAVSQEDPIKPPNQEEMMKRWQEFMTPGKPHAWLEKLEGKWTTESTFWMSGPEGEAMKATGQAEFKMILGGRFLEQKMSGEMFGMPSESRGYIGYDNYKRRFSSLWLDNFGTGMYVFSGHSNRDGKTIRLYGTMDEPTMKMIGKHARFDWTLKDDDTLIVTGYDLGLGDNAKVMQVVSKRVKEDAKK